MIEHLTAELIGYQSKNRLLSVFNRIATPTKQELHLDAAVAIALYMLFQHDYVVRMAEGLALYVDIAWC